VDLFILRCRCCACAVRLSGVGIALLWFGKAVGEEKLCWREMG
jgi:hypothetical protein